MVNFTDLAKQFAAFSDLAGSNRAASYTEYIAQLERAVAEAKMANPGVVDQQAMPSTEAAIGASFVQRSQDVSPKKVSLEVQKNIMDLWRKFGGENGSKEFKTKAQSIDDAAAGSRGQKLKDWLLQLDGKEILSPLVFEFAVTKLDWSEPAPQNEDDDLLSEVSGMSEMSFLNDLKNSEDNYKAPNLESWMNAMDKSDEDLQAQIENDIFTFLCHDLKQYEDIYSAHAGNRVGAIWERIHSELQYPLENDTDVKSFTDFWTKLATKRGCNPDAGEVQEHFFGKRGATATEEGKEVLKRLVECCFSGRKKDLVIQQILQIFEGQAKKITNGKELSELEKIWMRRMIQKVQNEIETTGTKRWFVRDQRLYFVLNDNIQMKVKFASTKKGNNDSDKLLFNKKGNKKGNILVGEDDFGTTFMISESCTLTGFKLVETALKQIASKGNQNVKKDDRIALLIDEQNKLKQTLELRNEEIANAPDSPEEEDETAAKKTKEDKSGGVIF